MEQQRGIESFGHFCQICKGRFASAGALALHRGFDRHGSPASKSVGSAFVGNPRVCDECGKEFSSWKALFGHAACHSDPPWRPQEEEHDEPGPNQPLRQRMRTRPRPESSSERGASAACPSHQNKEEELAECLVMLSTVDEIARPTQIEEDAAPTCASTDAELDPLGPRHSSRTRGLYECNTCMKKFHSFQALGGHRASHKKLKSGRDAVREESESLGEELISREDPSTNNSHDRRPPKSQVGGIAMKQKAKVHKCSICQRVFASGQALGGHKRCHWTSFGAHSDAASRSSSAKRPKLQPRNEWLDLNLPAPVDEEDYSIQIDTKTPPPENEMDSRPYIIRGRIEPPRTGGNPRPGLLLYNYDSSRVDPDDEADSSKLGNKRLG